MLVELTWLLVPAQALNSMWPYNALRMFHELVVWSLHCRLTAEVTVAGSIKCSIPLNESSA